MLNTLRMSLKIDITYAINSFLYALKHNILFKHIFTKDLYHNEFLKKIVRLISIIFSGIRVVGFKALYLFIIFYIANTFSTKSNSLILFINIYFFLTIIGMFINTNMLNSGKKKYYNIILMNMDARNYALSYLTYNTLSAFLINFSIIAGIFSYYKISIIYALIITLIAAFTKICGEALNIYYYKKTKTMLISNSKIYFSVVLFILLLVSLIVYLNIPISLNIISSSLILIIPLFIVSLKYILNIKDFKLMYKRINTEKLINSTTDTKTFSRQSALEVRDKDKLINPKKLQNKHGYDLFNTIFFERHKALLNTSAKNISIVIGILFVVSLFIIYKTPIYNAIIGKTIIKGISWLLIIMYFINRGSIITQAMFFNCDKSMLTFNFYREPKTILNVFKERLKIVTKVNLLPAFILGLAVITILIVTTNPLTILEYILLFLAIISMSVFFSVHYLVIYYLLQPYNVSMQMKSFSYQIASFLTYLVCYMLTGYIISPLRFSCLILGVTIIYIIISLVLVYKKAPETFRLK